MRKPRNGSFYDLLGIGPDATPDEIRRAFLVQANRYHPDLNRDNPQAEWQFKQIRRVYEVLSDPLQRAAYDECPARFCLDDVGVAWNRPTTIVTGSGQSASATGFAADRRGVDRAARSTVSFGPDDPQARRERRILLSGVICASLAVIIVVCTLPSSQSRSWHLTNSFYGYPRGVDSVRPPSPQRPADRSDRTLTEPRRRGNGRDASRPGRPPEPGQRPTNPRAANGPQKNTPASQSPKSGPTLPPTDSPLPAWSGAVSDWPAMPQLVPGDPSELTTAPWRAPDPPSVPGANGGRSLPSWPQWTSADLPQPPIPSGPQPATSSFVPLPPAPPFIPNYGVPEGAGTAAIGSLDAVVPSWSLAADAAFDLDPVGRENLVAGFRALVNPKKSSATNPIAGSIANPIPPVYRPEAASPFAAPPAPSFVGPAPFAPSGPFTPVVPFNPAGPFMPSAPSTVSVSVLPLGAASTPVPPPSRIRPTRPPLPPYYRPANPAAPRTTWP